MKVLVDFLAAKVSVIAKPKYLTNKELFQVTDYAREAYLDIRILLRCDISIYRNLIKKTSYNYATVQENYPINLPKIQNLLANWYRNTHIIPRPPLGGLSFTQ